MKSFSWVERQHISEHHFECTKVHVFFLVMKLVELSLHSWIVPVQTLCRLY